MTTNTIKLLVSGVLAVLLVIAIILDSGNRDWAVPLLTLIVGYVVGNAKVTDHKPIIGREG